MCGRSDYVEYLRRLCGSQTGGFDDNAGVILADKHYTVLEPFCDYLIFYRFFLFAAHGITVYLIGGFKS